MKIDVRALPPDDLDAADAVLRDAFATMLGADVLGGTDPLRTRFRAAHVIVLGGYVDGEPAGSIAVTGWGGVGTVGPLSVRPDRWGCGVGGALVAAAVAVLGERGVTEQSLFTFPGSPRHVELYRRFGFWPHQLVAVTSRTIEAGSVLTPVAARLRGFCGRSAGLAGCAALTAEMHPGLDPTAEIVATLDHGLGDVVLLGEPARPDAFAICHVGAGTEAGAGVGYVKFAAARPGVPSALARVLRACDALAAESGAVRLVAGVATARRTAYRELLGAGFRTDSLGVAMHRPDGPGHDRPEVLVLDDRR